MGKRGCPGDMGFADTLPAEKSHSSRLMTWLCSCQARAVSVYIVVEPCIAEDVDNARYQQLFQNP